MSILFLIGQLRHFWGQSSKMYFLRILCRLTAPKNRLSPIFRGEHIRHKHWQQYGHSYWIGEHFVPIGPSLVFLSIKCKNLIFKISSQSNGSGKPPFPYISKFLFSAKYCHNNEHSFWIGEHFVPDEPLPSFLRLNTLLFF